MADESGTEVGSVFVSNYPPYSVWSGDAIGGVRKMLDEPYDPAVPFGLYLHIPFCRKRCKFCYFKVYTEKDSTQVQTYLDGLAREVELYGERARFAGRPLNFVYFGGGTPSYVSVKHLRQLLDRIQQVFPWDGADEVTFECEPGTLSRPKLEALKEMGMTRISLGVENFNDAILEENGRAHLSEEIERVLPWIAEVGFPQVNIDLIAGMVGETWEAWRDTVQRTIDAGPDSVTVYQMELPFNTVYSRGVLEGGSSPVADWQTKRAWQAHAFEALEKAGYEVSSAYTMLKRGTGARFVYRDALWHGADLLGTGVASFSHVGGFHFQNATGWDPYLGALSGGDLPLNRAFATGPDERLVREFILQMKLGNVPLAYFRDKFGVDPEKRFADALKKHAADGLLEVREDRVRLTREGLLQVDFLLPAFYADAFREVRYT